MKIIGILISETFITIYDLLSAFNFKINEQKRIIEVYHNDKYEGTLGNIVGMDEDRFIKEALIKC